MSLYVLAPYGVVEKYPFNKVDLRISRPDVSFPMDMSDAEASEFFVFPVTPSQAPEYNPITSKLVELPPALENGSWVQKWMIQPLTSDEFGQKVDEVRSEIVRLTQQRLDDFAKTRNYDGILSACTYATSSVPKFAAEGKYCVNARDQTWATLYSLMAEVQAGTRPMPTGFSEIESELPVLEWPAIP